MQGNAPLGILTERFSAPASLSEAIAERLGRAIAEGRLRPNQRLKETQLCEEFGVSRTPMREALRIVAAEGLVEISSRRGARVAHLSSQSISDVFTVRMTLEGLVARLAVENITPSEIKELRAGNEAMRRAVRSGDARLFLVLNAQFHRLVGIASRNAYLASLQESAAVRSFRSLFLSLSNTRHLLASVADHGDLLNALEKRDPSDAERIMQKHVLNTKHEALRLAQKSWTHDSDLLKYPSRASSAS